MQDSQNVAVRLERCRLADNAADHDGALYLDFVGRTQNTTVEVLQVHVYARARLLAVRAGVRDTSCLRANAGRSLRL